MARAIDADRLADGLKLHRQPTDQKHEADRQWAVGYNAGLDRALHSIAYAPTLTQPNEGAKDKNVPTNGPLALEELRPMAEPTPVWWDWVQGWVLARKGMIISWNGVYYNFGKVKGNFYRRPPEGEEET